MFSVSSWGDLFQVDKCEQFLDHYRHPFENLPFCMEEIKEGESLILVLQGVIEEECDEYYVQPTPSSMKSIEEELEIKDKKVSAIIVRHGKTSLTLGWKLPEDRPLLKEQLSKDWASAKVDGELECTNSLKHTYIDYGSSSTSASEVRVLMTNGGWLSLDPENIEFEEKESACFDDDRGTGFYSNFFESREEHPYLVAFVTHGSDGFTIDELKDEGLSDFKQWILDKIA